MVSQLVNLGPKPPALIAELERVPPYPPQFYTDYADGLVGTWGGYVQLLDNEASYLGQLGEDVTDVNACGASPSSRPTTR